LNIRHHILQNLEKAAVSYIPEEKETLSSIAIVGGGPTGVELAGANMSKNKPLKPFKYNDKGSLTTIGKKKAVAKIRNKQCSGFFAWLIWSFVHLLGMFGARNKLLVAVNWMWSYFNYEKGDRVIIRKYRHGRDKKSKEKEEY
jgi:NADH dehydrogenase FAD-containing subunit